MLTYEHDDSDSDAVREAKRRLYNAQLSLQDAMTQWTVAVATAQQDLDRIRREEGLAG